ncbi:FliH/SctL family protein [Roseateles amylovorans]|uniref:Flagellar assembly protein FliH n=1 Tax=Roseateles amylovorans TaxID=2978473 RepID=A0ABY6B316_9BURK|nr:FliH/SctL family protein [Roseateles amylovorans]UXH79786.1 FliH/SctL family protein [Roseateles amylovorans]
MATRPPRQVPPPPRAEGESPRGSTYSRIIPREELSGFAAWNPGSLDGGQAPRRPPVSAPPPVEPPAPPPPPQPSIDELLHAARQSGYQDGYRDGMAALDAFKQSFAKQISAQVGTLVTSFDADLQALEQDMAGALARTAVELARQVVRNELVTQPELIAQVAHDAVEALLINARHVRVRVHPDDLPLVLDGAGEELRAREAQVIPDPAIARGGCKIDADICSVDATLPSRWQQAVGALGQSSVWEDRRAMGAEHDRPARNAAGSEGTRDDRFAPRGESRQDQRQDGGRQDGRHDQRQDARDDFDDSPRSEGRSEARSDPRSPLRSDDRGEGRGDSQGGHRADDRFDPRPSDRDDDRGEPRGDIRPDHRSEPRYKPRQDQRYDARLDASLDSRYEPSRFGDDTPA